MEEKRQPWDRLPNEPSMWFNRFEYYRLLGPDRTFQGTFEIWNERDNKRKNKPNVAGHPHPQWYERAEQWQWKERAAEWDNWVWKERVSQEQDAIREMTKRHIELGMEMQDVGGKALGDEKNVVGMGDARLLIKDGADLERRARGLPDYLLEISGMTDEELLEEYERVVAEETVRTTN